jgi:cytochrome-b5 reductase
MDVVALLQQGDPAAVAVALLVVLVSVFLALKLGKGSSKPFLDPQTFQPLTLTRVDQLTHNTKRFVFALPHPAMRLGLPTGQHITFAAKDAEGKDVYRCVVVW